MSRHSPVVEKIGVTREHAKPIPLPDNLPKVPEFEPELLPSVLAVRAQEIAKTTQAPIDFIATGFLVAASSLVARHIAIRSIGW